MAKKNLNGRKPRGTAGIAVIEDPTELDPAVEVENHSSHEEETTVPKRERKAKANQQSNDNFGVGDIRKAAAFANSIGGLDKAIALLQILKVAKEVQ